MIAARPRDLDDALEVLRTRQLAQEPVDFALIHRWAVEWDLTARLDTLLRTLAEPA
ncbi:MAG: hypothetical protein ABI629_16485 [bacterium]